MRQQALQEAGQQAHHLLKTAWTAPAAAAAAAAAGASLQWWQLALPEAHHLLERRRWLLLLLLLRMLLLLLVISTDSSRVAAAVAAAAAVAVAAGQLGVACTARNNAGVRAACVAAAAAAVAAAAAAAAAASSCCGRLGCGISASSLLLRLLRAQPGRLARHWLRLHRHAGVVVLKARQRAGPRAVDHLQVEQAGAGRAPGQHRDNQALVSHVDCAVVVGHWEAACCAEAGGVQAAAQPSVAERDIDT